MTLVPAVRLQCVIVVFPDHTHLFFEEKKHVQYQCKDIWHNNDIFVEELNYFEIKLSSEFDICSCG